MLCPRLSARQAADPFLADRLSFRLAHGIFGLADGNVEYLLGKLSDVARTFGHEPSMPQAAPPIYPTKFQTEALPKIS